MCVYCMMADFGHKYWPYPGDPHPMPVPETFPQIPAAPWTLPQLDEFEELLRRIKALEDAAGGCPCPDKAKTDFLADLRQRVEALEADDTPASAMKTLVDIGTHTEAGNITPEYGGPGDG